MVFGSIVSSPLGSLSPQQALQLANVYLDNACNIEDPEIALVLCHDTEVSLSQAKKAVRRTGDQEAIKDIAAVYINLGKLLERRGYGNGAQTSYKKAVKLGGNHHHSGQSVKPSRPNSIVQSLKVEQPSTAEPEPSEPTTSASPGTKETVENIVMIPDQIFAENVPPPTVEFKLPEADERLNNTPQLVYCLSLLHLSRSTDDQLDHVAENWLQVIEKDTDEQERLHTMATEVIRVFKRDELKDAKAVAEVVCLSPVLNKDTFHDLLREFYSGIDHSGLLNFHQLEGLAQLIQGANSGHLGADDLVKILDMLSKRLRDTHQQSTNHLYQLTLAVSHVLDAMADTKVTGLDRETLHEPLSNYLKELTNSSDPYLVYQAAYAYQALLCVPDNETAWQSALRRTGKVVQGVSGLVSAVKNLDLNKFIEGLGDIQKGVEGASAVAEIVKSAYEDVASLAQSGKGFLDSLKEGFSFERKRDWYSALRGADTLIQGGEFATFRELVCRAQCRRDPAFQWGVCQRLGDIAANSMWDIDTRQDAIEFLGEIYRNDNVWGRQTSVKQWILNILTQLAASSGTGLHLHTSVAKTLLRELESEGDTNKQILYRMCQERGFITYPSKIKLLEFVTPSLLDRVQNRPDVEGNIRQLRKQRVKERGNAVYVPPQAKASLQSSDDTRFPLMEKVKEFLTSDQKVLLLMGDSGAGKSTFTRELEIDLWQSYKAKTGSIPLYINLPAIDKPEHDLIAKQLRRAEFTEQQIREMKHYRKFILICDGYDESQQTHNLYMSNRLNQPGEWDAQMVISCRSEYLGIDYRERFKPGDRNQQSDLSLFQEAVIASFSIHQVQAYIRQYVSIHQPLWQVEDYKQALELIPTLKDLVTNPFLMTLSLEVLPRMVDPGQNLSATQVTRVELYDHFVEQWLERGKKRLGEKDLNSRARAAFESLTDEGFTLNGIAYLKKLAVAIYKEQHGHPIVEYSRFVDETSWKSEFFDREDKRLLREACPLTRNGNQHRFIHRSLLEYGLARAIFDPQDKRNRSTPVLLNARRGSASSTLSFEFLGHPQGSTGTIEQDPDINSPLVWRDFVNDHSLLQFLEERVQQEPIFKQQLLAYIEHSKKDQKWRAAAANAITILVRAGVQFIGTDFQGIRIPGADLSYGVFDSVNLQGADLRKTNLRGAWLRQSSLERAQMTGVQFGESLFLNENNIMRSCAYSPDGKSFAVGNDDGNISIYTTSNWERIQILVGHTAIIWRVVYSPSGDQIASCSEDQTVRLWDSETNLLQHILIGHTGWVRGVSYSPQVNQVASVGDDMTIRLWDVDTGDCQTLPVHHNWIGCVAYSPNGKQIGTGSDDSTIRLWNVETRDCSHILAGHSGGVWAIAYSPRDDQIASAGVDKTIRLWDVESGACRFTLSGHSDHVNCVEYSPSGEQVASGGTEGSVKLWDVDTGICRQTWTGHNSSVAAIAFSPRGDQIASVSHDKTIRLWDVSSGTSRLVSSGHSVEVCNVRCSPKGDLVATCSVDTTICIWDAKTGTYLRTLRGHTSSIFCIAFSHRGDRIVSGGADWTVRVWNVATGACLHTLHGHSNWIIDVAYSPQGDTVVSADYDQFILLWDVETGECHGTLYGHSNSVMGIAYSPDGSQIASGSDDHTLRVWDLATETCLRVLKGHSGGIRGIAYSPHGKQLATASGDTTVRLWDAETGECQYILIGHSDMVKTVGYSKQGNLLASGDIGGMIRVWDGVTGQCRAKIQPFQGDINGVDWITSTSSTGTDHLIASCYNGSVLNWEVVAEKESVEVRLHWICAGGRLNVTGASMQDVRGLSHLNKQLLKQRGAIGEPVHVLREAGKKLITMSSVVSRFKHHPADPVADSTSVTSVANPPLKQQSEQFDWTL